MQEQHIENKDSIRRQLARIWVAGNTDIAAKNKERTRCCQEWQHWYKFTVDTLISEHGYTPIEAKNLAWKHADVFSLGAMHPLYPGPITQMPAIMIQDREKLERANDQSSSRVRILR